MTRNPRHIVTQRDAQQTIAALFIGLGASVAVAAPAAAAEYWYWGGFSSYSSCHSAAKGVQAAGARIAAWCQYRSSAGSYGFTYYA